MRSHKSIHNSFFIGNSVKHKRKENKKRKAEESQEQKERSKRFKNDNGIGLTSEDTTENTTRKTSSTLTKTTEQGVDIYQYPAKISSQTNHNTQLTIGDLHANAIKLIFFLIKENIIALSESDYQTLIVIYGKLPTSDLTQLISLFATGGKDAETGEILIHDVEAYQIYTNPQIPSLDEQDFDQLQSIMSNIIIKNIPNLIRLMGDEAADRGACDLFVLYFLLMMHTNKLPYEILLSNHGIEFIIAYEKLFHKKQNKLEPCFIADFQVASMIALQLLLDRKIISEEKLFNLIDTAYKPYLKVLSYSLSEDGSHITIYSHAGIDLTVIKALAAKFNIVYNDTTAFGLAATIDSINNEFQKYANQNKIHTLCDANIMNKLSSGKSVDPAAYPIEFIMWNRSYENLKRVAIGNENSLNPYTIAFAHAHDSNDATRGHIFNTDNQLGKRGRAEAMCTFDPKEHEYTMLSSNEKNLSELKKKADDNTATSSTASTPTNIQLPKSYRF